MSKSKKKVLILDGVLLIFLLLSAPIFRLMFRFLPDCPFAAMGFLCPSCGGTRCLRFLLRGQFADAFWMNPFIFLTAVYLLAALIFLNVGVFLNRPKLTKTARAMTGWKAVVSFAAAFAVFGILRNFV